MSEYARQAARQAVPTARNATSAAAQQAMPLARTAGTSVRQGADSAVTWVTPYTDAARAWAAPRLEQSAIALNENIAPMISEALIAAAHKIDSTPQQPQRRVSKSTLLAASLLFLAAGAAALIMRNQGNGEIGYTADSPSGGGEAADESVRIIREQDTGEWPDADSDGYPHIS